MLRFFDGSVFDGSFFVGPFFDGSFIDGSFFDGLFFDGSCLRYPFFEITVAILDYYTIVQLWSAHF